MVKKCCVAMATEMAVSDDNKEDRESLASIASIIVQSDNEMTDAI